jgi:hypothetical protein
MWPAWIKPSWIKKIEVVAAPEGLEGDCWLWRGACTPDKYPRANIANEKTGGEAVYLHRYSWEQHHHEKLGKNDGGHLCGRSLCIQHEHIEKQTPRYNRGSSTAMRFDTLRAEDVLALACGHWLKTYARHA